MNVSLPAGHLGYFIFPRGLARGCRTELMIWIAAEEIVGFYLDENGVYFMSI